MPFPNYFKPLFQSLVVNHSYENEFNLHVNERMSSRTYFGNETRGNSEMAYCCKELICSYRAWPKHFLDLRRSGKHQVQKCHQMPAQQLKMVHSLWGNNAVLINSINKSVELVDNLWVWVAYNQAPSWGKGVSF